jgi:hypothetical protein
VTVCDRRSPAVRYSGNKLGWQRALCQPVLGIIAKGESICLRLRAGFRYIGCLGSFRSLDNLKFYRVSFLQRPVTVSGNRRVMHKYIRTVIAPNESVSF